MAYSQKEADRIVEAYLRMAKEAKYRPAAPSDGFGHITISKTALANQARLAAEADAYARKFIAEEDSLSFWIGCSNWKTNRAFVFAIEAARLMAGAAPKRLITKLLEMALEEVKTNG